jgi:putative colanic acid biosynthesis acetyltransferase WcaF
MGSSGSEESAEQQVIRLSRAPGEREAWPRSRWKVYLWAVVELLLVSSSWQISSTIRVRALRAFGAQIGTGVIFRPRTRVKFPWNLRIGDDCWIGEGVWFHNQALIDIEHDTVISQETMLTTGSHSHRKNMALLTSPITIGAGTWVTSRCLVLGGTSIGRNSLVSPMSVVRGAYAANKVISGNPARAVSDRFPR